MSYSRWSNSKWYTFWSESDATKKEDEVFEICGFYRITYGEIKKLRLNGVIKKLKSISDNLNLSENDWDELKIYIKRFIKDVDEYYFPKRVLDICKNCDNFQTKVENENEHSKLNVQYICKIGEYLCHNSVWDLKDWESLAIPKNCPNRKKMIIFKKKKKIKSF